ncbi:hypothetical protein chiPu_0002067 [Chiloscyllium punctatum]|uniref:Secreted protein n=1 Tax=Chiloscyllium punctatum TaxID=137246 RepID=A0A401RZW6_CHIPU|nr:hypothetical protein [Chiloscyllium punctatum]
MSWHWANRRPRLFCAWLSVSAGRAVAGGPRPGGKWRPAGGSVLTYGEAGDGNIGIEIIGSTRCVFLFWCHGIDLKADL